MTEIVAVSGRESRQSSQRLEDIKRAVKEFEALFISQMLKEMRSTVMQSDLLHTGSSEDIYTSMLDTELSRVMAGSGGIGLGDMLLKELSVKWETNYTARMAARTGPTPWARPYAAPIVEGHGAHQGSEAHINDDEGAPIVMRHPVEGRLSSEFGMREDPITGHERFHHGIDIAAEKGSPIYPAMPGRVVFSGARGGYGNVVEVAHEDGTMTRYAHTDKNLVSEGDIVNINEPIAYVGSTGRSTGPHLHFEVIRGGVSVDPRGFLYG